MLSRYKVLRVGFPRRADDGERLQRLVAETAGAEVWRRSVEGAQEVWEVLVPPSGGSRFASDLSQGHYSLSVKIEDVQKYVRQKEQVEIISNARKDFMLFCFSYITCKLILIVCILSTRKDLALLHTISP